MLKPTLSNVTVDRWVKVEVRAAIRAAPVNLESDRGELFAPDTILVKFSGKNGKPLRRTRVYVTGDRLDNPPRHEPQRGWLDVPRYEYEWVDELADQCLP